jgi:DNA polymerase-1
MAGGPNPNAVSDQLVAGSARLATTTRPFAVTLAGRSADVSAEYKAVRKLEDRAVLYHQIDLALDRLRGDGFPSGRQGFEADDIIASAALKAAEAQLDVMIVSADKDLLQLICDREAAAPSTKSLKTGDLIDEAAVEARFGVRPSQMRDY